VSGEAQVVLALVGILVGGGFATLLGVLTRGILKTQEQAGSQQAHWESLLNSERQAHESSMAEKDRQITRLEAIIAIRDERVQHLERRVQIAEEKATRAELRIEMLEREVKRDG
jgi:uncharacterized protein (DUF3084 family)